MSPPHPFMTWGLSRSVATNVATGYSGPEIRRLIWWDVGRGSTQALVNPHHRRTRDLAALGAPPYNASADPAEGLNSLIFSRVRCDEIMPRLRQPLRRREVNPAATRHRLGSSPAICLHQVVGLL